MKEIYNNENYGDNLILTAVRQSIKARRLRKQDVLFLREVANIEDSDFCNKLASLLPGENPRVYGKSRTQMYLSNKRYNALLARRLKR